LRTGARVIEAFRTSHVVFVFMVQERHISWLSPVRSELNRHWAGQITPMELADQRLASSWTR
jgi:hypothetical protein